MKTTYIFEWTHLDGTEEVWRFDGYTRQEAVEAAIRMGWKPPHWWQWWRWSDGPRKASGHPLPTSEEGAEP